MTEQSDLPSVAAVYERVTDESNPVLTLLQRYIPERWNVFTIAVLSTIVHRLTQLVPPYLLGVTLDAFFTKQDTSLSIAFIPSTWVPTTTRSQFLFIAGLFITTALFAAIVHLIQFVAFRWFQQSALHALRVDVYATTQRLDIAFFEAEETGDIMSVLNNDVNQLRTLFFNGLQQFVAVATFLIGLSIVMLALHWQLTLLTMSFLPLMGGLTYIYQRLIEPQYDDRRAAVGKLNTHVQNVISGIETIKAFNGEDREQLRLRTRSQAFWHADWTAAKISGCFFPVKNFLTETVSLGIIVIGGWWVLFGPPLVFTAPLTTGTFVTFLFYGRWLVNESAAVGDLIDTYIDAQASAKRVFGLLNYPTRITDPADPTPLNDVDGHVTYHDVSFTYPDADSPAVRGISFEAEAGQFVGLVGATGAGKSTAMKLLPRFYDPDGGVITIDGTDVSQTTLDTLRDSIGYVSQEPFLFHGSVRKNIAYSAPDAAEETIVDAAKRANAHEFIQTLPEQYDTEIGERGVRLSGGQRQRIALARVVLTDPEILILDEATSHVDNKTEILIQNNLEDLIAERTTVAVAHRLSTVRKADTILVLEHGAIVEQGTHDELLEQDGLYAHLWNVQVGEVDSLPDEFVQQVSETS